MKRLFKRLRQNATRVATQGFGRLPVPLTRLVLRMWFTSPTFGDWPGDSDDGIGRFDRLAAESAPQSALSLASKWSAHPRRLIPMGRVADALGAAGHPQASVTLMRAAVERYPDSAAAHAGLAQALRQLVSGSDLGARSSQSVVDVRENRLLEAEKHLRRATAFAPNSARFHVALAELLFERGQTPQALALIRQMHAQHRSAETAAALGRALHRSEVADFDSAVEAYREALRLDPRDRRTAARLNSVALRAGSWAGWEVLVTHQDTHRPDARRTAVLQTFEAHFRGQPTPSTPAETTARLLGLLDKGVTVDPGLLHSLSAHLQAMGEFRLGFDIRRALAEQVALAPTSHLPRVASFHRWASAMSTLGRSADALERFRPYPWDSPAPESRGELDGMRADLHLSMGTIAPLVEVAKKAQTPLSPADARMAALVQDKRVAIVGPGAPSGAYGAEIDEFDIVIRPRFSPTFVRAHQESGGARTDVTYYSGTDVHVLRAAAFPAAEAGEIQLIVARPVSFAALAPYVPEAPWLRFYRRDYSLIMNGGPLGITRIVHDVLQFEPSQLALYNVDYYTGSDTFARGYRAAADTTASPGSILMDLFRAHDLRADFDIHRRLFARGVLSGPPEVEHILRLTPDEYVLALERAWAERPSPTEAWRTTSQSDAAT